MKKKSVIALALALVMVLSLFAGCGASKEEAKTRSTSGNQEKNAIAVALTGQAVSLDPQLFTQVHEDIVINQVYESLFVLDNDSNPVNILCESFTPDETGSSVEFVLKSGVKFHGGEDFTSADVEYALSRCENSALCSDLFTYSTIEVQDDTHFTWNFPYAEMGAGFYELMSVVASLRIASKSWCEGLLADVNDDLGLQANGTGAYMLGEISNSGDITLNRFEDYHGEASIDTIYYKLVTGSQELAFESGDLDIATYGGATFDAVKEYTNVATMETYANNVSFLINNCDAASPMNSIQVREAAVRAMNRGDVNTVMFDGASRPAYNMATPLVQYYDDCCDHFDQDAKKAQELMTAAGYSESNPCAVTVISLADPKWVAACEVLKENLEQAYFAVTIEEIPDTTRYFTGEFDIGLIAIGLTNSFTSYASLFDDASGLNLALYHEPDQQELIDKIMASGDEAAAHEAMQAVVNTLAYVPLGYTTDLEAYDANLTAGIFYTANGDFFYREFSWNK